MNTVNKKDVCQKFNQELEGIKRYVEKCKAVFNEDKLYLSYSYENAIIMVYREFERFVLRLMISCLNHDHSHFEDTYGIKLGKHINDDVCEFLITKGGYFDFNGYSGLIKSLYQTIGEEHSLIECFKQSECKAAIQRMCTLRNYAAHNSSKSKKAVLQEYSLKRAKSAGSLLKQSGRFNEIVNQLVQLSENIKNK